MWDGSQPRTTSKMGREPVKFLMCKFRSFINLGKFLDTVSLNTFFYPILCPLSFWNSSYRYVKSYWFFLTGPWGRFISLSRSFFFFSIFQVLMISVAVSSSSLTLVISNLWLNLASEFYFRRFVFHFLNLHFFYSFVLFFFLDWEIQAYWPLHSWT